MKLKCQWCGNEFEASRKDTKYCSRSCQSKASRDRKTKNINPYEKICNKCGKNFLVKDNAFTRRYCYECVPVSSHAKPLPSVCTLSSPSLRNS